MQNTDTNTREEFISCANSVATDIVEILGIDKNIQKTLGAALHKTISAEINSNMSLYEIDFLDIHDNKQTANSIEHKNLLFNAISERYKAYKNGELISIKDVLLHSDKRYILYNNEILLVEDVEAAKFIEANCLVEPVINTVFKDKNFEKSPKGNTIELLTQYLCKANRIRDTKYTVLSEQYSTEQLDDEYFEFMYIREQMLETKFDVLYKFKYEYNEWTGIDIAEVAKHNNIYCMDLLYRLYNKVKLSEAIKLGIQDREKYGLRFYRGILPAQGDNTPDNMKELIVNIIKEELKTGNKEELKTDSREE